MDMDFTFHTFTSLVVLLTMPYFTFTMKTRAMGVLLTFAFSNVSDSKLNDFLFSTFTMNNESEVLA